MVVKGLVARIFFFCFFIKNKLHVRCTCMARDDEAKAAVTPATEGCRIPGYGSYVTS